MTRASRSGTGPPGFVVLMLSIALLVSEPPNAQGSRQHKDLVFAVVDGKALGLDLYLPASVRMAARCATHPHI